MFKTYLTTTVAGAAFAVALLATYAHYLNSLYDRIASAL